MYEGYRLKINGVVFPNTFMAKGTWQCLPNKRRLVNSYHTADGKRHDFYHPKAKADIRFSIRKHNLADHEQIAAFFREKYKVSITFWCDDTCAYETRICKIGDVTWTQENALSDDIFYNATSIVITED